MDHLQNKIDILTGELPGTYTTLKDKLTNSQKFQDHATMSSQEFQRKYSPFYHPELRMTIEEIKQMDAENLALFKENEAKRKAANLAKRSQVAC
jgi:hypothetical protein